MFRIVIVEDEPRILRNLKEKINVLSPDFKVVGAYDNGEDALFEMHWTLPHALITDIRMPIMDGIRLITEARIRFPDLQCAILSGHDDFSYLREAIKLGITDYLLKPADDSEISRLLAQMKSKVLHNKSLLEDEVLLQISGMADGAGEMITEWNELANELFYFGHYVLVYLWSPNTVIASTWRSIVEELLTEGETIHAVPAASGNEFTLLLGVHSWSQIRQNDWIMSVNDRLKSMKEKVTAIIAPSFKGLQPIPALLSQTKKFALAESSFNSRCILLQDNSSLSTSSTPEQLSAIGLRLTQFVTKQQKTLFLKELEHLISLPQAAAFKRRDWETMLMFLSHTIHNQLLKETAPPGYEARRAMEMELAEEVWRSKQLEELKASLQEIWGAYFFRTEQAHTTYKNWAQEAKELITSRFHDNISLTSIADHLSLNPTYLNRVFKRTFQISIPDYLNKVRMEEACQFIRQHPFVLIKEIAEHVGFQDPYYFSKVFKQFTGFSPTEFKNMS